MAEIIELAKKLKALAERGEENEKQTADQMLRRLMAKHNITLADIEGDKIFDHPIKIEDQYQWLLRQIQLKVASESRLYGPLKPKDRYLFSPCKGVFNYVVKCTKAEFIEIMAWIDIIIPAFQKEQEAFEYAFCLKNDLLTKPKEPIKATPEQQEMLEKALAMAGGIDKQTITKRLNQ